MNLRRWGHAITRNFAWKLGSLVLAVVLWFAIVGEPEVVTAHSAPILYRNLEKGLLVGGDALDAVRVELRGPAGRLSSAALGDLAVELDLADIESPGERTFTVSGADLRLPDGISFVRAIPSQIHLRFSRRTTKEVPVQVRFSTPPPSGYAVVRQEISPERLQIAGPQQRVDAVTAAQTDAIDLSQATTNTTFHVNTFVSDPQVWFESAPAVSVRLTIEKQDKKNDK